MMQTQQFHPDAQGLAAAADILRAGGLVAFPTETVYGLGADARNDLAVAGIFAAKGRPRFNPLIVHVPNLAAARAFAIFDRHAEELAERFWPGPLTLVLPLRRDSHLSELVTAQLPTVAIRVPAHPSALALLDAFGGPLAAPSANPSGKVSPTSAAHVTEGLAGKIAAIIDGGACAVGVESTILEIIASQAGSTARLLRPGGLAAEQIEALIGPLTVGGFGNPGHDGARVTPNAPGQLASHYAPNATLRLNVITPTAQEVLLGFGAVNARLNLSASANLTEAAANLFGMLRQVDKIAGEHGSVAVSPIPMHGLGLAINDRLQRAAAPRS
jgi:L-threonylcarbamoyladenylate synthase